MNETAWWCVSLFLVHVLLSILGDDDIMIIRVPTRVIPTTNAFLASPKYQCCRRHPSKIEALYATVEDSMSIFTPKKKKKQSLLSHDKVIYQKVIRPPQGLPDILFLGYLIEYLEQHFQLPSSKLSMIYETYLMDSNQENDDDNDDEYDNDSHFNNHDPSTVTRTSDSSETNRCLLAWDSPLSPCSEATRMEVEVVGVYTKDHNTQQVHKPSSEDGAASHKPSSYSMASTVPNMAMVVVRKKSTTTGVTIPPMMQNLFHDSERKILQALDKGLEDFGAGNVKKMFSSSSSSSSSSLRAERQTIMDSSSSASTEVDDLVDAELVEIGQKQKGDTRVAPEDVVFDAYATSDNVNDYARSSSSNDDNSSVATTTKSAKKKPRKATLFDKEKAIHTMKVHADINSSREDKQNSTSHNVADFAVEAAKRVAVQRKTFKSKSKNVSGTIPNEDFAVASARRAAERRKTLPKNKEKSLSTSNSALNRAVIPNSGIPSPLPKKSVRGTPKSPKTPRALVKMNDFQQDEENDTGVDAMKEWKPKDRFSNQRTFRATISTPETWRHSSKAKGIAYKNKSDFSKVSRAKKVVGPEVSKQHLPHAADGNSAQRRVNDTPTMTRATKDEPPREVTAAATSVHVDKFKAAEKVLEEIAEQGQDMTAEEMLRDILKFDEMKKKEESAGTGFASGAFEKAKELLKENQEQRRSKQQKQVGFQELDKPKSLDPMRKNLTPEEELKAMFAAGQRLAEGRITKRMDDSNPESSVQSSGTTMEDVDRLIDQEKSISNYARKLDEELAELELSINPSIGEELDPPSKNPFFDIMSGPEVYNPNVDLNAVNYPGALPGTKEVRLPKELKEAIQQAEFAAAVLEQLKTVESKDKNDETQIRYYSGKTELTTKQVENLQKAVTQASQIGIIDDPVILMAERSRLQIILDEMWNQPEERFAEIAESFRDLLLSTNLVRLIRERLEAMADRDLEALRRDDDSLKKDHEKERNILGKLVEYAQALLKQARAVGAELEAQQLEIVRSICKIAMDPSHVTEEETATALSDAVRDMRPLLDEAFVAYLKYAVAEEEARLSRQGVADDPDYNQWLFVLKIVQQGVYAEIAKGINRHIEHIWYVLRMETPRERRLLLEQLIDDMPTMDVRPFVNVVENIVGSLGDGRRGDFDGIVTLGEMTNKLLQLHQDVKDLLPPERIALKSKDADEWAAMQKKRLLEQRKIGEQRLQAAKELEKHEDDIQRQFGNDGEVDHFD